MSTLNQRSVTKKREEFHKQKRAEQLQAYMKKKRMELMESIEQGEHEELRKIIDELFSERLNEEDKEKENEQRKKELVLNLIKFANEFNTTAIVAISELLLNRIITVENIEDYYSSEKEQKNGLKSKKEIMQIINFPTEDNDGWLALIRVLLILGYCTEDMIIYCINTLVRSQSKNALDLSLEVICILVIEKKLISIEELYKLTIKPASFPKIERLPRTEEFVYALMNKSLDSLSGKECSDIRYNSTKLLMKSFETESILNDLILKLIPLSRIAEYIKEKFQINKSYDKKKALKMLSCLLICLSNYNHYEPEHIISTISSPIMPILDYIKKLSYNIDVAHSLNERKEPMILGKSHGYKDENFEFLEEAIFMIEILIDDYLFCTQSFDLIITSLEAFILDHILINLYSAYHREIKDNLIHEEGEFEWFSSQDLTEEDLLKSLLVEKIIKLTKKLISNLIRVSSEIRNGNLIISQENTEKFVLVRNLIISRFRKSELYFIPEQELDSSGINLQYI